MVWRGTAPQVFARVNWKAHGSPAAFSPSSRDCFVGQSGWEEAATWAIQADFVLKSGKLRARQTAKGDFSGPPPPTWWFPFVFFQTPCPNNSHSCWEKAATHNPGTFQK